MSRVEVVVVESLEVRPESQIDELRENARELTESCSLRVCLHMKRLRAGWHRLRQRRRAGILMVSSREWARRRRVLASRNGAL